MKKSQHFQTLSCLLPAWPKSMYDHTVSFILMLYFCLFCSFKISVTAVLGQPCRWTYSFLLWRLLLPTDRKWVSVVVNKSESEKSMLMVKVNTKGVANFSTVGDWITNYFKLNFQTAGKRLQQHYIFVTTTLLLLFQEDFFLLGATGWDRNLRFSNRYFIFRSDNDQHLGGNKHGADSDGWGSEWGGVCHSTW